jgi:NAD(P)-dependent dehydrogenase (short-subunit alcohol dehydrogenase family)
VAALEWAGDGIRVNVVHPDGVSGTGADVACRHVAAAVLALCGDGFARTTGAEVTVDGGDRVT